jgi:hypothetical protein
MICANGEQKTPVGETGVFFICKLSGNVCQFVRWCYQRNCYEASTNKNGGLCKDYIDNIDSKIE